MGHLTRGSFIPITPAIMTIHYILDTAQLVAFKLLSHPHIKAFCYRAQVTSGKIASCDWLLT